MRFLVVFGTRPEAVKLAPVIAALKRERGIEVLVCLTGQHRDLVESVLDFFGMEPDFDLGVMADDQALNPLLSRLIQRLDNLLAETAPDRVIVQGDTSSALAAALAAFHRAVPVAHVEAGLRTYRPAEPFPEELNRRAIGLAADLHFAPTRAARANLIGERLRGAILVTGNSGVDALDMVVERLETDAALRARCDAALPAPGRKLVLATAHRRESFGAGFAAICTALAALAARDDVDILFPLQPNPALRPPPQVPTVKPLDLPVFVRALQRADLVLTDSGGVQEDAVTLGRPLLVLRDVTERPEGVEAGAALRVGTDPALILHAAEAQLARPHGGGRSQVYGDGRAAGRIADALLGRPVEEFARDWPRIEGVRRIG